jgi:dGTPase
LREVDSRFGKIPPKLRFNETLRRVLDYFVTDLITTVGAIMENFPSAAAVRRHPGRIAAFSPAAQRAREELKAFLFRALYHHPRLADENLTAERMVTQAFERYLAHPESLPPRYRSQIEAAVPAPRVICDYLAGMTDDYIKALAARL